MYLCNVPLLFVCLVGLLSYVDSQSVVCPAVRTTSGWLDLFPLPCRKHTECGVMSKQHLCCKGFCTKGIRQQAITTRPNDQPSSSVVEPSSTSTSSTTTTTSSTTTSTTTTTPSTTSSTTTTTTTTTTTPKPPPTQPPALPNPLLQLLPFFNAQLAQTTTPQAKAPTKAKSGTSITDVITDVNYSHARNSGNFYEYDVDSIGDYSSAGGSQKLVCPKPGQAPVLLFPIPCENNAQCRITSGPDQVCCEKRCVKGVPAQKPVAPRSHQPLLGVIPRECPSAPLGELLFEVQSCKTDADCWPRVCCPDGTRSYCRTAKARLDRVPIVNQIDGPVRMFEQYLQCTAAPQYDIFPKPCSSSVDCFPNLCCAEGGKKHCRPAQRSLLALIAGLTGRVGSTLSNLRQLPATQTNRV